MEYQAGNTGRVFYIRLDDGEDLHAGITELVSKENVRCAWFHVFGGLRRAGVVIGPREPVMPPEPVWKDVNDTREVVGTGSVFWDDDKPLIHLHAAMGHHGETLTGCVRKDIKVYLILELMLVEVVGIDVTRPWFKQGGFNRPTFSSNEK